MHPGSLCLLGPPCAPHCCDPGAPSAAVCSGDASPAFGLCLPSCHQGTLWLLDDGERGHGHAWSCEPSARTMSWDPRTCCTPGRCLAPAWGAACGARGTPNTGPGPGPCPGRRPSCHPCTWTLGRALHGPTRSPRTTAAGRTLSIGSPPPCAPALLPQERPAPAPLQTGRSLGQKLRKPWLRPASCPPLSCVSRNIRPLSHLPCTFPPLGHLPSTFPPLRYLRSGCRA
ncbi:keratin-associated protein 24-1 [Myotis lucifugus]|uniref:keratin-associated protein 24-1 n=1 Tax=Myotis lucifugus TaxID=59463 RepID=UPI0006D717EE|nr:keratin-associated protein 24-1 [Myotis lucifugus]